MDLYADAAFYDAEFSGRDHELPFYLWLCGAHPGPVLEVACGTGRLTIPVAQAGHDITGVDVSPEMVALAQDKAPGLAFSVQDCRTMEMQRRFGTVFIATNALQHLHRASDIRLFLERVRQCLAPNGILALDVFNPDPEKLRRPISTRYLHKTFRFEGEIVEVYARSEYSKADRILHFDLSYCRGGEEFKTKSVNMRSFPPEELAGMCEASGFQVTERFGDYDRSPFEQQSPKQILLCKPTDANTTHGARSRSPF